MSSVSDNSKIVRYKTVGSAVVNNVMKHIVNTGDCYNVRVYDFDKSYDCVGEILITNIDGFTFRVQTVNYCAECCECKIDLAIKEALEYVIFYADKTAEEKAEETAEETAEEKAEEKAEETAEEKAEEKAEETAEEKIYYRSLIDNKLMTVGNFFDMCYITFITTYNHDIDILNDYFNGDYDKIEKTTKEEIIDIISLYIIKWAVAHMRVVEIRTHGGGKCKRKFHECVTKCFRDYKRKCKQYFHII